MSVQPGTRLGHYEILTAIGKGGMGEVWKARDTTLRRYVAIKTLPAELARDAERLTRLEREAELLATLNHPNVATIHGLEADGGTRFLVLELVDGDTLDDRVRRGAIPVRDSLALALQIAQALEAAHQHNVIHRDLKPANIKITPDGRIKVLDFGLGKALAPRADAASTHAIDATEAGVVMGTPAYMSPEQARGLPVDKRTDIWAFGCVLYELLTGRQAFPGTTTTDVLVAILEREPDWTALPATTPSHVTRVLRRCLEKDPRQRLRDIGDARLDLESREDDAQPAESVAVPASRRGRWVKTAGFLVAGAGLGWLAAVSLVRVDSTPSSLILFVEALPPDRTFEAGGYGTGSMVALSPNGRTLVYLAQTGGAQRLFSRSLDRLDQLSSSPIGETAAREPFFSPDGEWIGYRVGQTLKRMSAQGGPADTIAVLPSGTPVVQGIRWSRDGTILVGAGGKGLMRVPERGGTVETLATPAKDRSIFYPQALPGGRAVLYTESDGTPEGGELRLLDLAAGTSKPLGPGSAGQYLPTGHIVFVAGATLWAVPFDVDRLEIRGTAVKVVDGVRVNAEGGGVQVALTDGGALAYLPATSSFQRTLVWVDRQGKETPVGAPPAAYANPRVSPDGTRIAVTTRDGAPDVHVWDVSRGLLRQLTFDHAEHSIAAWVDDQRLAFSGRVDGWGQVFLQAADGTSAARQLTTGLPSFPFSVSRGGELLLVREYPPDGGWDIGLVPVQNPERRQTVERTRASEHNPVLSPDRRWLTYQSNKTGRYEIYARAFPLSGAAEIPVTAEGGTRPVWAQDSSELFYWTETGDSVSIKAIRTTPGPPSSWGAPRVAVEGPYVSANHDTGYDVWGGRFLLMKNFVPEGARLRHEIVIAQNWFGELPRLAPPR